MSQPRKATARGDPNSQVRNSNVRDHNLEPLTDHPKLCHRSRSKNRIPKSLRFDLENALVGLCDMWFEEIKPHLISNKIKVHIHDLPEAASGDHCRPSAPADAPGCSHLDPGAATDGRWHQCASYVSSCSTPPTASKARFRRRPPRSPCLRASSPTSEAIPNCDYKSAKKPPKRRALRPRTSPPVDWRVPRLCRTYRLLTPHSQSDATPKPHAPRPIQDTNRPIRSEQSKIPFKLLNTRRRPVMVDKSTQTPLKPSQTIVDNIPRDLVNIIGEAHDKQLKLLFLGAKRLSSSRFNLVDRHPKQPPVQKCQPWR